MFQLIISLALEIIGREVVRAKATVRNKFRILHQTKPNRTKHCSSYHPSNDCETRNPLTVCYYKSFSLYFKNTITHEDQKQRCSRYFAVTIYIHFSSSCCSNEEQQERNTRLLLLVLLILLLLCFHKHHDTKHDTLE